MQTPRGSFSLTDLTKEQMQAAGYSVHHESDDRKYLIMGNGIINNGSREETKEKPSIRERLAEAKRECSERTPPEKAREDRSMPEHNDR